MKCPICRKDVGFEDPHMPFCSERCRLLDLGQWFDEEHRISTDLPPDRPDIPPDSQ